MHSWFTKNYFCLGNTCILYHSVQNFKYSTAWLLLAFYWNKLTQVTICQPNWGVQIEFSCRKIQITCSKIEILINWRKIASDFSSPELKAHNVSLKYTDSPSSVRRRPSVVVHRRPHFQTWLSLKLVGQSWLNFMCSITGVGGKVALGFGADWIKTLVSVATESSNWLIIGKMMFPPFLGCFWFDPFYTCR